MYNMHGHPWSIILNPDKKDEKIAISKPFFEKLKDKVLKLFYKEESSEDFLRQFWESIDLVQNKEKGDNQKAKFNGEDDISLIV
jgi:hypothetical protein